MAILQRLEEKKKKNLQKKKHGKSKKKEEEDEEEEKEYSDYEMEESASNLGKRKRSSGPVIVTTDKKKRICYLINFPKNLDETAGPVVGIIDCPIWNYVTSLVKNSIFSQYREDWSETSEKPRLQLTLLVHLTTRNIFFSKVFRRWVKSFGTAVQHILVEKTVVSSASPFRSSTVEQIKLNTLNRELFPLALSKTDPKKPIIPSLTTLTLVGGESLLKYQLLPQNNQRLDLSMVPRPLVQQSIRELSLKSPSFQTNLKVLQRQLALASKAIPKDSVLPSSVNPISLVFLGTGLNLATDNGRSGLFIDVKKKGAFLVDPGEASYAQMLSVFGPHKLPKKVMKIKIIFVSSLESDCYLGLTTFLKMRQNFRFKNRIRDKDPLIIIGPTGLGDWQKFLSKHQILDYDFYDLQQFQPDSEPLVNLFNSFELSFQSFPSSAGKQFSFVFTFSHGRKIVYTEDLNPFLKNVERLKGSLLYIQVNGRNVGSVIEIAKKLEPKYVILTGVRRAQITDENISRITHENSKKEWIGVALDLMCIKFPQNLHLVPPLVPHLLSILD
eukprot:TRINITY_DN2905_c0_g1_i2.p1 TRINITY_DN2905_c0_g1~~TRINITY_DN2905_c0_g1_i2.p1  ORF type:complete len:555 (-),score=104.91 TRINITY_DN2905_c0_g1_i2:106-1770(-)